MFKDADSENIFIQFSVSISNGMLKSKKKVDENSMRAFECKFSHLSYFETCKLECGWNENCGNLTQRGWNANAKGLFYEFLKIILTLNYWSPESPPLCLNQSINNFNT